MICETEVQNSGSNGGQSSEVNNHSPGGPRGEWQKTASHQRQGWWFVLNPHNERQRLLRYHQVTFGLETGRAQPMGGEHQASSASGRSGSNGKDEVGQLNGS